jgi:Biopolymer transport protein ExbD/TolR
MYDSCMRTRLNLVLSIAAGIFGGTLLHCYSSAAAYAQVQTLHKSDVKIPTVRITGDGALYLNNKAVNINLLANEIKRSFPKASEVRVRPDKDTPWDVVSQVFAALNAARPPIRVRPVRFADLKNSE